VIEGWPYLIDGKMTVFTTKVSVKQKPKKQQKDQ